MDWRPRCCRWCGSALLRLLLGTMVVLAEAGYATVAVAMSMVADAPLHRCCLLSALMAPSFSLVPHLAPLTSGSR
jgi:hypothetical protein